MMETSPHAVLPGRAYVLHAIMKTTPLIVFSVCFIQAIESTTEVPYASFSLPAALLEKGLESLREIAEGIFKVVLDGQKLIHSYSDNSTNYAAILSNITKNQVFDLYEVGNRAIDEAEKTVQESNSSILACYEKKREEIKDVVQSVTGGIGKCAITQIGKFADLGIFLAQLGNTSVFALLQVRKDMLYCSTYEYTMSRLGCIGVATGKAAVEGAKVSAQVAVTTANALSLLWNARTQLWLCLQGKVAAYKIQIANLPLNLAACTTKSVYGTAKLAIG